MAYRVTIGGVLLPVAPEKIEIKVKSKNDTVTLIDGAEMDILKKPGLSEITFSAELPGTPGRDYAVYDGAFQPPAYFLNEFERLALSEQPFVLQIIRELPNGDTLHKSSFQASIGDYTIMDDVKEGFDTVVKLNFRQYDQKVTYTASMSAALDGSTKVTTTKQRAVSANAPVISTPFVTVPPGATLWSLAKQYLGDGSLWTNIAQLNGIAGNRVAPGQMIRIR